MEAAGACAADVRARAQGELPCESLRRRPQQPRPAITMHGETRRMGIVQANDEKLKEDVVTSIAKVWDFMSQNNNGIM